MLRAFTVPLANLRSRNEYKKFRPICYAAILSWEDHRTTFKPVTKRKPEKSGLLAFFS